MFFDIDLLSFTILDVVELKQGNSVTVNCERNFSALSFRFASDTVLQVGKNEYYLGDNTLSYIPTRLNYIRNTNKDDLIAIHLEVANYHTDEIEYFIPKEPKKYAQLFKNILEIWNKKKIGYKYQCTALLCQIFSECYIENRKSAPNTSKIKNSLEYISLNYKNKDLKIADVAKQSFMSEVYFRKLFKSEFGISPQKYIVDLRIQNAVNLISTGYFSLKEIAELSGYGDYKYFSVEFKRHIGVSPSEYRYNFLKYL